MHSLSAYLAILFYIFGLIAVIVLYIHNVHSEKKQFFWENKEQKKRKRVEKNRKFRFSDKFGKLGYSSVDFFIAIDKEREISLTIIYNLAYIDRKCILESLVVITFQNVHVSWK